MIDGIKIYIQNLSGENWLSLPYLSFITRINEQTGEELSKNKYAEHKGLIFELKPSTIINNKVNCFLRGSLAKYYNNGLDNAFDYDFTAFESTLRDVQDKFNIIPEKTVLKGFEFGINLSLPFPAQTALKHLKTFKNHEFAGFYMNGKKIGYKADRQQYTLKIYDKGSQTGKKDKNLLRIEIQVKKMEFVKAYTIRTLADLAKYETWEILRGLLLCFWSDCLYINDKDFDYKDMPNPMQKKFLRYINPQYWQGLNSMQRMRAKQDYKRICTLYQRKDEKEIITRLIAEKLENLKLKEVYHLTDLAPARTAENKKPFSYSKCIPFNPLDKGVNSIHTKGINKSLILIESKREKKARIFNKNQPKKCVVCSGSLKFKTSNAKYCSKRCNNNYHNKKRKRMNQKNKKAELLNLDKIIKIIPKNRLWLSVTYKYENLDYTDILHQWEILTSTQWIGKVKIIKITGIRKNSPPVILTAIRAKKLIRILTEINNQE